ncbi:MAG: MSHA biogenesis protein MshO [Candidatus Azotimanducaceae bacterium]|jgi:MSHA biogenesis protein MshO
MRVYLKQTGFSLIELIVVIVLLGVLATGAGMLITTPIGAYNDQLRRQQLVDQAEMSLRHITKDIRRSLPNSLRFKAINATGGWALEMANTVNGARYRDEPGGNFNEADDILDFHTEDTDFNFLGTTNILTSNTPATQVQLTGQRLVIYNTQSGSFYTDVTATGNIGIVTPIDTVLTLSQDGIEQHLNINPGFKFTEGSPDQRAYFIDGPISYICDPSAGKTNIIRYSDYAFQKDQPDTWFTTLPIPTFKSGDVVTQILACGIGYESGTAQRGGIITINMTLGDPSGEAMTILTQIHVQNVP